MVQAATPQDFMAAMLDLEKQINGFGDGLPRGARDEYLAIILEDGGWGTGPGYKSQYGDKVPLRSAVSAERSGGEPKQENGTPGALPKQDSGLADVKVEQGEEPRGPDAKQVSTNSTSDH
jgi:hypothetical protein